MVAMAEASSETVPVAGVGACVAGDTAACWRAGVEKPCFRA
jgi:hypothetical protein